MVEDVPGYHASGMVPILDNLMSIINSKITHHYYSKPMALLELVSARSAMSMASKINILVQNTSRRVRNYSIHLHRETKVSHINTLMCQMMWSGYSQKVREVVARRTIAKLESD